MADGGLPDRGDRANWPALRERLTAVIAQRTTAEWSEVFAGTDACVAPVLSLGEAKAGDQLTVEGRLQRAHRQVAAVGGLVRVVERRTPVDQVGAALVPPGAAGPQAVEDGGQQRRAVHHGRVDHLSLAGGLPLEQRGEDADGEQHPAAAEVPGQVDRRQGAFPVALPDI